MAGVQERLPAMPVNNLDMQPLVRNMKTGLDRYLQERNRSDPLFVGIHTGGVWVAQQLQRLYHSSLPLGKLNIAFYRDDFSRIGLHPRVTPSSLPFDVGGRHVILIDDVLYTGRTVRAAMNELFDYGRAASICLAVLVDRGGRELPIQADVAGRRLDLAANQHVKLSGPDPPGAGNLDSRMTGHSIQLDQRGRLKHFLTTEGLDRQILANILDYAESFAGVSGRAVKKVPLLRGKTVANLFFEASTRTRTTFELAAKRLSADVLNVNIATSATNKGEALQDTLHTLEAMHCDLFVVRHGNSGAAHFIAGQVADNVHVINAGDGRHAHPTQAMLDLFTMRRHKPDFESLRIAIVGDIAHSRVARSNIHALNTLGVSDIRVIAPKTLVPVAIESLGVRVFHDLDAGLSDVDVISMLRLQRERISNARASQ